MKVSAVPPLRTPVEISEIQSELEVQQQVSSSQSAGA